MPAPGGLKSARSLVTKRCRTMFGREKTGTKSCYEFEICGEVEAVSPEYFVVCVEYLAMESQTNFIAGLEKIRSFNIR